MSPDDAGTSAAVEFTQRCEVEYLRALLALAQRQRVSDHEHLADRLADVEATLAGGSSTSGPMSALVQRLGLQEVQARFLWAAVAFSADPRLATHAEALGGPLARRGLSAALYADVLGLVPVAGQHLAVWLAGANPLVDNGLLVSADDSTTPAARPYVVPQRLLAHLMGIDVPDASIQLLDVTHELLIHDPSQTLAVASLAGVLAASVPAVVIIEGPTGTGRTRAAARAAGRTVSVLDVAQGPRSRLDSDLISLRRELCLNESIPMVTNAERALAEGVPNDSLSRFVDSRAGHVILATSVPGLDLGIRRPVVRVRWTIPDTSTRRQLWASLAQTNGNPPVGDLDPLALRYRVGPGSIAQAVASTRFVAGIDHPPTVDELAAGLRHNIAERVGTLAQRVEVTQTWDDLVLADDTREQVDALLARVRYAHQVLEQWQYKGKMARGTGVPALFSGSPGTGKTMTAGLIARELDLELYQVDLSQVVSKWVGETEKQLSRVFEAAEEGHALLLFDECDALFGQRSAEVKGAVDRYANLEVNYLLQRIEAFGGITILTTNLDANIDRALKRRLAAHIVFDPPDEEERAVLWQRMTATGAAPLAKQLDFDELARKFPTMTGANIRNAVLSAAFFAAAGARAQITQEHLLRAARVEYRSMGHMLADRTQGSGRLGGA